uniref:Uncharacterized protein n=1 Tax=Nelumbo nucifera TaxID=4432 RepID=A0A822XIH7_NELNU|nr:TPA_asm: hypothetical protein HUJ06_020404 [Nelumbo nucifera]
MKFFESLVLTRYIFRWFKHAGESFVKVPFFGAVSYLTIAVCPFCIAFAVVWAVYRRISFAWIGQDILVRGIDHLCILILSFCNTYSWSSHGNTEHISGIDKTYYFGKECKILLIYLLLKVEIYVYTIRIILFMALALNNIILSYIPLFLNSFLFRVLH